MAYLDKREQAKSKTNKSSPAIASDESHIDLFLERLPDVDNDAFEYKEIAKDLASTLMLMEPPFVYAICGKWGSGKSSFLKYLLSSFTAEQDCSIVIYFNAWRASIHHDILSSFVYELTRQLTESSILKPSDALYKSLTKSTKVLIDAAIETFSDLNAVTKFASTVYQKVRSQHLKGVKSSFEADYLMQSTFMKVSKELSEAGIIPYVLIDELDRCPPSEVVRVIEALRQIFCGPDQLMLESKKYQQDAQVDIDPLVPFKYLLTIDEDYVARAFVSEYHLDIEQAHDYISKFIHFRYHFPPKNWAKFIENFLNTVDWARRWNPVGSEKVFSAVISTLKIESPREVRRILVYLLIWQKQDFETLNFMHSIENLCKSHRGKQDFVLKLLNGYIFVHAAIKVVFPSVFRKLLNEKILPELVALNNRKDRIKRMEQTLQSQHFEEGTGIAIKGLINGMECVEKGLSEDADGVKTNAVRDLVTDRLRDFWKR